MQLIVEMKLVNMYIMSGFLLTPANLPNDRHEFEFGRHGLVLPAKFGRHVWIFPHFRILKIHITFALYIAILK